MDSNQHFTSTSQSFRTFCNDMTEFAETQLDLHRPKFYAISRHTYSLIMNCYSNPRQTNEEADTCAQLYRDSMGDLK